MRTGMLALALGLLSLRALPWLPSGGWLLMIASGGLLLTLTRGYHVGLFALGLCWACAAAHLALGDRLGTELDGQTLWLEGEVVGLPSYSATSVRFELAEPWSRRAELPRLLRLSWYGGPAVASGERWRLAVKLKRPRGQVNPGGFDAQAWALGKGVGAMGSVKAGERVRDVGMAWRDSLRQRLLAVDSQGQGPGLAALVLGDGSGVSRAQWETLQATGTVHLLVISGQHIGLLAGLIYGLISGAARIGLWPRRWPWLPWACGLAFAAAVAYGLLAGFQVPVQRACIMIAMVLLWRLRFRHLGVWWPLVLALTCVLVVNPLVSLQPGFWLSFCAVAVLLLVFSGRLGGWRWWHAWTRAQWCVALGLLPAMVALALPVSITGPWVNLVAVPWISIAVLPLALLGTVLLLIPVLGDALLWLAGGSLGTLFNLLQFVASMAPPWLPSGLSAGLWLLMVVGALLLLLPSGIPLRLLGAPMLGAAFFASSDRPAQGQAEIWQLDVGQGLAVLVRTAHHQLLYDAGPGMGETDAGTSVVVPSLLALGVRHLDTLIISHAHLDHFGGAGSVRRSLPVTRVLSGEPRALPPTWEAEACQSGAKWEWDGVRFELWRWSDAPHSNASSCVLWIEANGERFLLSGDIDAAAEQALLSSVLSPQAHWLQAPHHGSRTSSTKVFLQAVRPQGILISRGQGNTFGHPHESVLARYQAMGIDAYDNAQLGALRVQLGAYRPVQWLRAQRRFWRDPMAAP